MYSPQSTYALQLAQIAAGIGQQQYQWSQNEFNNLQGQTADNVNSFMDAANQGLDLAGNTIQQYENTYVPLQNQLVKEAGSYSGTARQNYNMGAAGSAASQANTAAMTAAKQNLTSMGIDPSSGMYGELEDAQKTAGAAATAGAEQQAMLNTQATGRQLTSEAINVGQALPAAGVNSLNVANNAIQGAANADIATANVGSTLMDSANPYLSTAMQLKYPPVGNTSFNTSNSMSSSQPGSSGGGSGGGGSGGGSSGGGSGGGSSGGGGYFGYSNPDYSVDQYGNFQAPDYNQTGPTSDSFYDGETSDGSSEDGSSGYAEGGDVGAIPHPHLAMRNRIHQNTVAQHEAFAGGGATTGGFVPKQASPSMGKQTDDIPARLNADEFVVPRDVVKWKGQEYFQKLIAQSRKARMTAPAAPSAGPPVGNQPPRFVSHRVGA